MTHMSNNLQKLPSGEKSGKFKLDRNTKERVKFINADNTGKTTEQLQ